MKNYLFMFLIALTMHLLLAQAQEAHETTSPSSQDTRTKAETNNTHTVFGTPLEHVSKANKGTTKTKDYIAHNNYSLGIPLAQTPLGESDVRILNSPESLENEPNERVDKNQNKKQIQPQHEALQLNPQ
ncbi:MAG: hypothetical protein J0G29_07120 [Alphaproteobacteria bacterium]|nr:hypothetical protein [Alphaproteobacteria bacterium]OJV45139.1 MAG: hypothetical protein BGO28_03905 [Alphaproteobacteria bacterium 43-37]